MPDRVVRYLEHEVGSKTVAWVLIVVIGVQLATLLFCLGLFLTVNETADKNKENGQTLIKSVCTLRHDYDVRIKASKDFLQAHPQGIPAIGLNRGDLLQSQFNMTRTRNALRFVDCTGVEVEAQPPPLPIQTVGTSGTSTP